MSWGERSQTDVRIMLEPITLVLYAQSVLIIFLLIKVHEIAARLQNDRAVQLDRHRQFNQLVNKVYNAGGVSPAPSP